MKDLNQKIRKSKKRLDSSSALADRIARQFDYQKLAEQVVMRVLPSFVEAMSVQVGMVLESMPADRTDALLEALEGIEIQPSSSVDLQPVLDAIEKIASQEPADRPKRKWTVKHERDHKGDLWKSEIEEV